MQIKVKRIYEAPAQDDGFRVLVDRLWPRGVSKEAAAIDLWLKEAAPSTELRRWFHQARSDWPEFTRRYTAELDANRQALQPLLDAGQQGAVTLLYASRDEAHNHAVLLQAYLETMSDNHQS